MGFVRLSVLSACSRILAHIGGEYSIPVLHVDSAKKQQAAHPSCLFTEHRLHGMRERRDCYAVAAVFPCSAALTDRSLRFVERCDLPRMIVLYNEIRNKVLFDHRDGA